MEEKLSEVGEATFSPRLESCARPGSKRSWNYQQEPPPQRIPEIL